MIFGWDVSTSIVGVAVFKDDGSYVASEHLDLRKVDGLNQKADAARVWIDAVLSGVVFDVSHRHFVEERLGNFAGGRTMLQVLMKLAAFNALFSYLLWSHRFRDGRAHVTYVDHLHPSTWKSLMKKEGLLIPKGGDKKAITLEFVRHVEPKFRIDLNKKNNPQPWMYDRADAYCIGRSGFLKLCAEKEN